MSDEELIKRICQGDKSAGEELIGRYYAAVFHYCRCWCGDRETAEDLTQETFLRLFRALPDYKERGKFRGYLFLIARRLCINEGKKAPVYPLEEGDLPHPENAMARAEDRDQIGRLMAELPPEQQEAVILRYGLELSFRDIAKMTGCNLRTAQSRVLYALRSMRKRSGHE